MSNSQLAINGGPKAAEGLPARFHFGKEEKAAVDALFEGKSGEMVTIYNAVPQTVSLEKVLGSGATGETSKGGSHNVDPDGFVVKTARNIGISFGD